LEKKITKIWEQKSRNKSYKNYEQKSRNKYFKNPAINISKIQEQKKSRNKNPGTKIRKIREQNKNPGNKITKIWEQKSRNKSYKN
jgi:hypothetical protein